MCIQIVPIPLHLLQTAAMLNSFVLNCGVTMFVIVFNKKYLQNCRWHMQLKMEQARRQDLAAGGPITRWRGQTPEGEAHF